MKGEIKSFAGVYASPAELKRATMLLVTKRVYKFSATRCIVENAEDFSLTKSEASKYYLEIFDASSTILAEVSKLTEEPVEDHDGIYIKGNSLVKYNPSASVRARRY